MKRRQIRIDRLTIFILAAFVVFALFIAANSRVHRETKSSVPKETQSEIATVRATSVTTTAVATTTPAVTTIPKIEAPQRSAAALYSIDDKRYIYTDDINEKIAPASLTKLLTASVALKYIDKDELFAVGSEQSLVQPYSSLCGLRAGNTPTLEQLVCGMLLSSGNDAAYAIAVSAARYLEPDVYMSDEAAVKSFCKLMNDFARDIGMKDSNFTNPDGWDADDQYTTASDLIKLTEYALSVPKIAEIAGSYEKNAVFSSGEKFKWTNSNRLLDPNGEYYCEYAVGMKTGTTLKAGNSLIAVFKKDKRTYVSVVAGCPTDAERYELTLKLFSLVE